MMKEKIKKIQQNWEYIAKKDPFWGVWSKNEMLGGKWNSHIDEFFLGGEKEIENYLGILENHNIPINFKGDCLDFGCGMGRVTNALAKHFRFVTGVDISKTMLEKANLYKKTDNIEFILNESNNLSKIEKQFAFIYTNIVLQHINPKNSIKYLIEFSKKLNDDGVLLFNLPTNVSFKKKIFSFLPDFLKRRYFKFKLGVDYFFDMYGIKKKRIIKVLTPYFGQIIYLPDNSYICLK